MDSITFSTVAWLLMHNLQPVPVPPFTDAAHCEAFMTQQGVKSVEPRYEGDPGDYYSCLQVWQRR